MPVSRQAFSQAKGKAGVSIRFKDGFKLTGEIVEVREGEFVFKTDTKISTIDMAEINAIVEPNGGQ